MMTSSRIFSNLLAFLVLLFCFTTGTTGLETEEMNHVEPRTFSLALSGFNSSLAITGTLIIGSLLLFSALLYALDVYATSRIDRMLVDSFGPEIYERFYNTYPQNDNDALLAASYADYYEGESARRRRRQAGAETQKLTHNEGRIVGLINLAFAFYNAADESLRVPECRKKLVCEVYSRPDDVLGEGYLGKTIKKGIEYLPYIQERYNVASEILDGKKDAEENRPCETKTATCNHLEKVLNGITKMEAHGLNQQKGEDTQ